MAETEEDLDLDVNEDADDKGKKKKKGGGGKALIIALGAGVGILVIALAVVLTLMLTGGGSKSKGEGGERGEKAAAEAPAAEHGGGGEGEGEKEGKPAAFYAELGGPFTVNFEDDTTIRFLQVEATVMTKEEKVLDIIKENLPVIRNNLILLLSGQDYAVIISREGKEELRAQAKAEVQKVVQQYFGKPAVDEVYFTSFVIQ